MAAGLVVDEDRSLDDVVREDEVSVLAVFLIPLSLAWCRVAVCGVRLDDNRRECVW